VARVSLGKRESRLKAVIVVPTIREEYIERFLREWKAEFADQLILIVEDNPEPTFGISASNVIHFSWRDIDGELGADADLVPRRTDCVRSFGFLKALEHEPDMIVTLDDDCYPRDDDFLASHWAGLQDAASPAWVSTLDGLKPRGMPYVARERVLPTLINHGMWDVVPDLDAPTQLVVWEGQQDEPEFHAVERVVPRGRYFPMCGMNLAFRPEAVPCLYFLRMGRGEPYDRFGDIWAGIFAKRICDHLGFAVRTGRPVVRHERASDVWVNLEKELEALRMNEKLWPMVDGVVLTSDSIAGCYVELAEKLPAEGPYWDTLRSSMRRWAERFL